jgi:hypothetical protein
VESCCEFGIEPSGSMKCWETIEWLLEFCSAIQLVTYISNAMKYLQLL